MTTVLIVDDHPLIGQGLVFALRAEGITAHVLDRPDVEMARALALVHQPALALVDLQFTTARPEGLGIVEALHPLTTVVVLTGISDDAVIGDALAAGATGFARKCEPFERLLDRILAALSGEDVNSVREQEDVVDARRRRDSDRVRRHVAFATLSPRECEVLDQLTRGLGAEMIAERTYVSLATVRSHIRAILRKLDVNSQLAAVARAHEAGWSLETSA
jgi:two-component system nitrate/nitrite response regulator NarL